MFLTNRSDVVLSKSDLIPHRLHTRLNVPTYGFARDGRLCGLIRETV